MRETSGLFQPPVSDLEERQIELPWEDSDIWQAIGHFMRKTTTSHLGDNIPEHYVWNSTKDDESPLAQPAILAPKVCGLRLGLVFQKVLYCDGRRGGQPIMSL